MGHIMFDTPTFEPNANNGPLQIRVASAMMILATLGVLLRFYAKRLVRQSYVWDDWLVALAIPCSWGICIGEIYGVKHGNWGRHIELATGDDIEIFLKALYACQLLYTFSIALTKFSITFLYRRLFQVRKSSISLLILEWSLGLRLVATTIVFIVPCLPIRSFWDKTISGKCINLNANLVVTSATNITTDIIILLFPIPVIWNLQLFKPQKLAIYSFFLLGGAVVLFSVLRLLTIIQSTGDEDLTWALLPLGIWTSTETSVAIFCACIPAMRPLVRTIPCLNHDSEADAHTPDLDRVHKRWFSRPSAQDNTAKFRRMGNSIEEAFGIYGPQTLITADCAHELGNIHEFHTGIHVEREIHIDLEMEGQV